MAKKKKKQQGHYCHICGEYKANEKFTGSGHARHICKACTSATKNSKKIEAKMEAGEIELYESNDILPETLPTYCEKKNFKKLGKDEKTVLKAIITDVVTEYWQEKRQIPFNETLAKMKADLIQTYAEESGVLLKDEPELKNYLHANMIVILNKLLDAENQEQKSENRRF